MRLNSWFSKSLLAVAFGSVLGYVVASSQLQNPLRASLSPQPQTKVATLPEQCTDLGDCCAKGLSRSEETLLVSHNQNVAASAAQTGRKPNILMIWGDDVGWNNPSAYNRGMMGYQTPNIDRVAKEGGLFTDWYGQQSCTAGRAAFMTGQSPFRTGLLKVGLPGAKEGLSIKDPTIPGLLKNHGYVTAQYGKNHLGDLDEHLPTNHGFDEFYGNLYHLNAEQEPEHPDYFKNPALKKAFGPRGVIKSFAGGTITDTGPLTIERMKTVDEEVTKGAMNFVDRAVKAQKPFFLWWNSTRMHIWTHLKKESEGKTGLGVYPDGLVEHDGHVGQLLDQLDKLGIADNTIVMYSTDNGAECFSWPDGGSTPFRNEKNSNWEGGYRVPCMIRWPGVIKPGTVFNGICSHEDMLQTLLAAVGEPDIKEKLIQGYKANGRDYKVHLDGYNLIPYFKGEVKESPRHEFFYWTDDGSLANLRYDRWKVVFMEQRAHGLEVWQEPLVTLRFPKLFCLRTDPFERADHEAGDYARWRVDHAFVLLPAVAFVSKHLETYQQFPPRQKPGSFNLDQVLQKLQQGGGGTR
jgi:arylsulfatase A-like enzyme